MLWNIIRDWFVMYIFGGMSSRGDYYGGTLGSLNIVETNLSDTEASIHDVNGLLFTVPNTVSNVIGENQSPIDTYTL